MRIFALCAIFALALLGGCARSRISTEIKSDGSWLRKIALTGPEKKEGMQMAASLEETFAFPSGDGWKSREDKQTDKDERTMTFERVLATGASLKGDLSIKGADPAKLRLVNEVTVTRAGARRFEYRETLRWQGAPPTRFGNEKPEDLAEIKAGLPKPLATDANARALAEKTVALAIPLIFGPGDPLLALSLLHPDYPDLAERRASQRIGAVLLAACHQQFRPDASHVHRQNAGPRGLFEW